jgi:hypothetical protein
MLADKEVLAKPDLSMIECSCGLRRRCARAEESALFAAAVLWVVGDALKPCVETVGWVGCLLSWADC